MLLNRLIANAGVSQCKWDSVRQAHPTLLLDLLCAETRWSKSPAVPARDILTPNGDFAI
jgi:hypothetical protein